jgi:hypothetical protein
MPVVQLYDGDQMTITHAKTGESFVIQGRLGTGKQIKLVFLQDPERHFNFGRHKATNQTQKYFKE